MCGRRRGAAQPAEDTLLLPKGDKSKYVLQTLNYIAEHYADTDINIASIARHIGISEGHLSHVFKKETNYTALGYLTQYRIHTARKLLRDCRYKVYEVAEMVGLPRRGLFRQHVQKAHRHVAIGVSGPMPLANCTKTSNLF